MYIYQSHKNEIRTKDDEWSNEELYGVIYDECMRACKKGFPHLMDTKDMDKPDVLIEIFMNELDEDKNLVDYYDEFYMQKSPHEDSDDVFAKWDEWMIDRVKSTIKAHKYKGYIK